MRSVALGLWVRTGSRDEAPGAGGRLALPRAPAVQGHRALLGDRDLRAVRRPRRRRSTPRPARRRPTCTPASSTSTPRRSSTCSRRCCSAPTYPDIDSEREVVLEEIAMYEDEPQDRVHDVLADAVFGEHPLGRRVLGERRGDRLDPGARDRRLPPRPLHGAEHRRRGGGQPRARARSSSSPSGCVEPPAPRRERRRAGGAPETAPRLRFQAQGDRAVPHLLRRPGHHPRRRAPLRARPSSTRLRRLDLLAPVPRGAREARARLRGRLLHRAVHGRRAGRASTSAPARTTSRRPARSSAPSCARLRDEPVSAEELARAKEHVKGRMVLSSESTAARMTRLARALLFDVPMLSLDEMLDGSTRSRVEDVAELAPSSTTRSGSRRPASAPTRTASGRRWRPVNEALCAA